jgi:type IV pilus assembly protein PilM
MGSASVLESWNEAKWQDSMAHVDKVQAEISTQQTQFDGEVSRHEKVVQDINLLVAPLEKRALWLELFKAVNECLPADTGDALDESNVMKQKKLRLTSFTAKKVEDVAAWHKALSMPRWESNLRRQIRRRRKQQSVTS